MAKVNPRLLSADDAKKLIAHNPQMKISDYFRALIYAQKQLNVADFQARIINASEQEINDWVEQFCYRNHLSDQDQIEIKNALLNADRLWLKLLAKNPTRQNLYEKGLMWWISYHCPYQVINLSTNDGALYAYGKLIANTKGFINPLPLALKSLDFKIASPKPIYVIAKYTDANGGGHQDNQRNDIEFQLQQIDPILNDQICICLDGSYWNRYLDYFQTKYKQFKFCTGDTIKQAISDLVDLQNQRYFSQRRLHQRRTL